MADSAPTEKSDDKTLRHLSIPWSEAIDFSAKSVLVDVGQPATLFHVDEVLLQQNSGFFAAALKKEWREGQKRVVELPEEDPIAFNIWLNWLYRRRVCLAIGPNEPRGDASRNSMIRKAYALGSVLLDSDFMDAATDAFAVETCTVDPQDNKCYVPDTDFIKGAYTKTPPGSKLCKLIVHQFASLSNVADLILEEHDPRFLLDIAKFLAGNAHQSLDQKDVISAAACCEFHEHKPGAENCYRTKYYAPFSFSE